MDTGPGHTETTAAATASTSVASVRTAQRSPFLGIFSGPWGRIAVIGGQTLLEK